MTAVLDATVAVDVLAKTGRVPVAEAAIAEQRAMASPLVAPSVIDLEVLNVLCRLERQGVLTAVELHAAVHRWRHFDVAREPVTALTSEVVSLRHNVSTADAFYVALARFLSCPLITSDRRLAAAPNLGVRLVLV
ncbi:MAG: type II toxin-antitoxin system VapC family toxin [Bifidobacteriaceae bacterium]|jgi:predicted nucleic acid-binding protein|nr:type II toxin-antitoxin system VapC family toxin [Bifidobacteriaceae bacterium]